MAKSSDDHCVVSIRGIAYGGSGVGTVIEASADPSLLGISMFVPFAAPGEQVRAVPVERKKRHCIGSLQELLQPSAARVEPPCRHFMDCGGCSLQHLDYDEQCRAKDEMIRGALRSGGLVEAAELMLPLVKGEPYGYRRRIQLHLDSTGAIGLYKEKSRSIVRLEECPICEPALSNLLPCLHKIAAELAGIVSMVTLESDSSGVVAVFHTSYKLNSAQIKRILDAGKKCFTHTSILLGEQEIGGYGRRILSLPLRPAAAATLRVAAGSFSQVNWRVNCAMLATARNWTEIKTEDAVIDLYAGAGNFALVFAALGAKVTAVEADESLVRLGRQNATEQRLRGSIQYRKQSVAAFLKERDASGRPKLIIADPPRSGLGSLATHCRFGEKFLLVSCHLGSFVRDVKGLQRSGWKLEKLQAFDMFSQTAYVESLALFSR